MIPRHAEALPHGHEFAGLRIARGLDAPAPR
jgi:hypothetical protein